MRKVVLLAVVALLFSGCGNKESHITVAETEGVYLDVGGLTYQVQLSRFINPGDVEDRYYLRGLPAGTAPLTGSEVWFGVWMRVKNYGHTPLTPATDFVISDTEKNEYRPVVQDPAVNPFIYEAEKVPGAGVLPVPDSPASSGPIQGSLILFRLKVPSLQNRPLVLRIAQGAGEQATVDLDL
jgi:hypothetical protein